MAKVFSMLLLVGVLLGCTTNSPRVMNTIDITKFNKYSKFTQIIKEPIR